MGRLLVLGVLLFGVVAGCSPYRPPPVAPPLVVARGAVRVVREPAAAARVSVVVRAGSAYDPPSREGLSYVLAHGLADAAGAAADVGPELVTYTAGSEGIAGLARVLSSPITPGMLAAGQAAASLRSTSRDCTQVAAAVGDAWIFAGHPYGHPAFGRSSVIPTLSVGELEAFRSLRYVRDAVVLAVEGDADVSPFAELFAPALSMPITPAVRSRLPMAPLVVVAPVTAECSVAGPRRPEGWTPADQAAAAVAAEILGNAPPPARVDPALHLTFSDAVASIDPLMSGDFEAARARVHARLAEPSAVSEAADILLTPIRRGHAVATPELLVAVDALTPDTFHAWVGATFDADAVRLSIFPDTATASTVESTAGQRVVTSEALLR